MIHIDFTLTYFQLYFITINTVAFLLYGYDKLQSVKNGRNISRVSENKLLLSTLAGGVAGSLLAMFIFRHKIKKPSFIIKFSVVIIIQVALLYLYTKGII